MSEPQDKPLPTPDLLQNIPRGDPRRDPKSYKTPAAAFADPQKVAGGLKYKAGDFFLGVVGGRIAQHPRGYPVVQGGTSIGLGDTEDRHIITVAGSRAGKGRSAIVPNLMLWPHSVLAFDPKGELASMTAHIRAKHHGHRVHVLDPFKVAQIEEGPQITRSGFNPLAGLEQGTEDDDERMIEVAALVADALVIASSKQDSNHWDESARMFIEGIVLHVLTHPSYEKGRNLATVREVMGEAGDVKKQGSLKSEMSKNAALGGLVQLAASDFYDRPDNERGSVLSTARRQLKFLDYPPIQASLRRDDLDLASLKTEATTVYLCLPARHIGTCKRWLRLFVNLTLQQMERTKPTANTRGPVLLCMDEFATIGHLQQIEDAAGQVAGYGVKLWPVLQDLTQLKDLYRDRWETFIANAGVLQFFGNSDTTTLKWIEERLGPTTVLERHDQPLSAQQAGTSGLTGESYRAAQHPLMTGEEISRYFGRDDPLCRQLIIRPSKDPIVLQRAYYDQHEEFKTYRSG